VPSAHAELIERSYRAFRDDDIEALLGLYHPEAVFDMTHWEGFPDARSYRGLAGIEEILRTLRDVFGQLNVRPVEIVDVETNRMFVKGSMSIRGKVSGVELEVPPFAQIFEFRDDLILRADAYSDLHAGRRAAGLTTD
jgi:ketosteroid isomerase-like protein